MKHHQLQPGEVSVPPLVSPAKQTTPVLSDKTNNQLTANYTQITFP